MAILSKQTGWTQESNLLWELLRELNRLSSITSSLSNANGGVTYADGWGLDAFGRLRISEEYTLGDYKHLYGIDPNFLDVTANGGTVTFQPNQAAARLATTTTANSSAIHQTKFYHQYMPGKSQLVITTFNFYAATTGVTKRTGYFDSNNGVFLQQDGDGTLKFIIRTYTSGAPVDAEVVTQTSWNVDPLNGTGPSGIILDITKSQILVIDLQWLGVGRVRCGFVIDGVTIIAHEFDSHANHIPVVYMSNPNLPVRCEITSSGSNAAAYMDQICSTVISEGGYVESGQDWAASNPTLRSLASGATTPIFAIRLKTAFNTYANRMIVRLSQFSTLSTDQPLRYQLIKLPNAAAFTTGTSWVDVHADSGIQYNVGGTAYTDGQVLDAGFVAAAQSSKGATTQVSNPSTAKKNYIVQNYDSTDSEIYIFVVTNLGNNTSNVGAAFQWREIY